MSDSTDRKANRSGKTASSNDPIETLRTPKMSLGDIDDLFAYVRKVARPLAGDEQELEDLVADGLALAYERYKGLVDGETLKGALSYWLESRLRDQRRKSHREWRRNSRAGTTYTQQAPTGLAWEHSAITAGMPITDESALIQSRLRLELFTHREDLHNPRLIGQFRGVPSSAGLATGAAAEVWASIEAERAPAERKPFRFLTSDDIE